MTYSKQTWVDGAEGGTPIDATRLNHIEDGIEAANAIPRLVRFVVNGNGSVLTTGSKPTADTRLPFGGTITRWSVEAPNESGSIVLDVWKDTYANWPPTNTDSITGSDKPTLSSAQKAESTTLTGWTTAITAGDIMRVEIESVSSVTFVILDLWVSP